MSAREEQSSDAAYGCQMTDALAPRAAAASNSFSADEAIGHLTPSARVPPCADPNPIGGEARDQLTPAMQVPSPSDRTLNELRELYRTRQALLTAEGDMTRRSKSIVKRAVGWSSFVPEKERKAKEKEADAIYKRIISGAMDSETFVAAIATQAYLAARNELTKQLSPVEKRMERLAKSLPVATFVEATRGFGYMGLCIIVGEAGDLALYANPGKLWKRMGLAPHAGRAPSQWKFAKGAQAPSAEDWTTMGYSPRRRSAMYVIGDSLIKCQGPYRDLYLARKVQEQAKAPDLPKMAHHLRAQRYMEKRLLRELWRAWNGCIGGGHEARATPCESAETDATA